MQLSDVSQERSHTRSSGPVLIVDDDDAQGRATSAVLTSGGYDVACEAIGDAVLRLVRSSLTRLVISEIYIGCSEGRCVVRVLKQDRTRLPRVRILVHTRHNKPEDLEWALASGCDAIVAKPTVSEVLLREVRRLEGGLEETV